MSNPFLDRPILNSPYDYPSRHWELDPAGQPAQRIIESRGRAEFVPPIPSVRAEAKRLYPGDGGKLLPRLRRKVVTRHYTPPRLNVSVPIRFANGEGPPCPNLADLAPPEGYDPAIFNPDCELNQVTLALALAFNDLHDAGWVLEQADKGRSATHRLDGYDGARSGLESWASRVSLAILHEAMDLIAKHAELLTAETTITRVQRWFAPGRVDAWNAVLEIATNPNSEDRQYMRLVRHNLAYHYHQPASLARGYARAFDRPSNSGELAYASRGERFGTIRYYFADAAVQEASAVLTDRAQLVDFDSVNRLVLDVATGVSGFVDAFLGSGQAVILDTISERTRERVRRRKRPFRL